MKYILFVFMAGLALFILLQFYSNSHVLGSTNNALVPGATNPAVSQSNIQQTICVTGWTATIRPPASYTTALKMKQMKQFGLKGTAADYELDHLISLELGGAPKDPSNLWPQAYSPVPGAHEKDKVENYLKTQVCSGKMTLVEAQKEISTDWLGVYKKLHPSFSGTTNPDSDDQ